MPVLTLRPDNYENVRDRLATNVWCIACLCAAWCDVCGNFRASFDVLASRHPDMLALWIDVEDEADLVGTLDVENFPTFLMQRGDGLAFYGPVEPDSNALSRLVSALQRSGGPGHEVAQGTGQEAVPEEALEAASEAVPNLQRLLNQFLSRTHRQM